MNRPPQYPTILEAREPRWRRWWLALPLLWGVQSAVLVQLWPQDQPLLALWMWSAVLPVAWALALALRLLAWRIGIFGCEALRRAREAATQRWWRWRSLGLPVEEVLLLGPAGDDQVHYRDLMKNTPLPQPLADADADADAEATRPALRCPVMLHKSVERAPGLGRHLARLTLKLAGVSERWPHLRAIAWVGDECALAAFEKTLEKKGAVLPEVRLPLRDLADLDDLIDIFHSECRNAHDWLLCAGVASLRSAEDAQLPGEGGFVWLVSRQGRQLLHRGESLLSEPHESPSGLCAQMQRYAGLQNPPPACLALDQPSQSAFIDGGWSAVDHPLAGYWGVLAHLAPFIGMSLALLQARDAGQPCGWLSQDADKRLAMGVAVSYANQ